MSEPITLYVHRLFGGPHDGEEWAAEHQYEKVLMGGPTPGNCVKAFRKHGIPVRPADTPSAVYLPDPDTDPGESRGIHERIDVETGESFSPPVVCVAMRFAGYAVAHPGGRPPGGG